MSKSSTTTSKAGQLPNPHPGEILLEEFLKPMSVSQNALARAVHVGPTLINEIVLGKRDVTADTDLRLARYFGLSEGFFLGLQMDYDLMQRRREIDRDLKTIRPRAASRRKRPHGKARSDQRQAVVRPAQRRVFRCLRQAGFR